MSGASSRRKGISAEREVVHAFRDRGIEAERIYDQSANGGPDVRVHLPSGDLLIESKRNARCKLQGVRTIAEDKGADAVACRGDRQGWWIALPLERLIPLLARPEIHANTAEAAAAVREHLDALMEELRTQRALTDYTDSWRRYHREVIEARRRAGIEPVDPDPQKGD